ncbi:MAG: hypothetical protein R3330_05490, partial [Saprospiraceae bacterium]|nr:hypothetical protein [Saprospiraceae bacterium]
EILFTVSTPGTGPMNMLVTHPGGTDAFAIPTGQITLSDYVPVVEGDYSIVVTDDSAGPGCTDAFMASIGPGSSVQISLVGTTPPSSPSGMDGTITISVDIPGTEPYTVLVNEMPWTVATGTTITIEGVGAGFYTVQLMDANGCISNVLNVEVPITGPAFSIGIGLISLLPATSLPELPGSGMSVPFVSGQMQYHAGGTAHTISVGVAQIRSSMILRFEHLTTIVQGDTKLGQLALLAGLGSRYQGHLEAPDWIVQLRSSHRISSILRLQADVGLTGKKTARPHVAVSVQLPIQRGGGH